MTVRRSTLFISLALFVFFISASVCRADGTDVETETISNPLDARTLIVPKTAMSPNEMAVIIDDDQEFSSEIGKYYASARAIPSENVIHVHLSEYTSSVPVFIWPADFDRLFQEIKPKLAGKKGITLTWSTPYFVGGMSTALAFASAESGIIRPTMILTTGGTVDDIASTKALIDKSVASDGTFPVGSIYLNNTSDVDRSMVRDEQFSANGFWSQYSNFMKGQESIVTNFRSPTDQINWMDLPNSGWNSAETGLTVHYNPYSLSASEVTNATDIMFYLTGAQGIGFSGDTFLPGALGDHVTSYGGFPVQTGGQMSAIEWLRKGATASFGCIAEPGGWTGAFPHTAPLISNYFQGMTAVEAYYSSIYGSVSNYVGEPLARPYGTRVTQSSPSVFEFETTIIKHSKSLSPQKDEYTAIPHTYRILASDSPSKAGAVVVRADGFNADEFSIDYPKKMKFKFTGSRLHPYYWLEEVTPSVVSIMSPAHGSSPNTWFPSVVWANSTTCQYKYETDAHFIDMASCSSAIPEPSAGAHTLTVNGGASSTFSTFTYIPPSINDNPPVLKSFSSTTPDGTYHLGDTINITATFNKPLANGSVMTVAVTGSIDHGDVLLNSVSGRTLSGTYTVGITSNINKLRVVTIKSAAISDLSSHTRTNYSVPIKNVDELSSIAIETRDETFRIITLGPSQHAADWAPQIDWGRSATCSYNYFIWPSNLPIVQIPCNNAIPLPPTLNETYGLILTGVEPNGNVTVRDTSFLILAPGTPVISNVEATSITASAATIVWTTDIESDSTVKYGPGFPLIYTANNSELTQTHSVVLRYLAPNTVYYFDPSSMAGGVASLPGDVYPFTTLDDGGDHTPPLITAFTVPATHNSLIIPITSFIATDNVAVAGYVVSESPSAPSPNAAGWTAEPPVSHTVSSPGLKTLYAYAKDAAGNVGNFAGVAVSVEGPPTPVITSALTVEATVGQSFNYQITAINNPTHFGATGLPTGFSINTANGFISGTPTAAGQVQFTISATSVGGTGRAIVTLTISGAPDTASPIITAFVVPATHPSLTVPITALTATDNVAVTGYLVSESAALPPPTIVGWNAAPPSTFIFSTPGAKKIYAFAKDAVGNVGASPGVSVTIVLPPPIPVITSALTPVATVGQLFNYQITAINDPLHFGATGLPTGFSINTANGFISGTPTTAGLVQIAINASNAGGVGVAALRISVSPAIDNTPPGVLLLASAQTRVSAPFTLNVFASENIVGLDLSDFNAVNATLSTFSGSGSTYSVLVSPISDGVVTVNLASNKYADVDGNTNPTASTFQIEYAALVIDTTPPDISMSSPLSGALVSGAINLSARATDNVKVATVSFTLDGAPVGVPGIAAPYTVTLNTNHISNGSHILTAEARDTSGNKKSVSITFIIDNKAPVVHMTFPFLNQQISKLEDVVMDATDENNVKSIKMFLDENAWVYHAGLPNHFVMDPPLTAAGFYTLRIDVEDNAGNIQTETIPFKIAAVAQTTSFEGKTQLYSYPNPADLAKGPVLLRYQLAEDSDVTVVIYDVSGNMVREFNCSPGTECGRTGSNSLPWNGQNDAGEKVAGGGYLVGLTARGTKGTNGTARFKVGVVR